MQQREFSSRHRTIRSVPRSMLPTRCALAESCPLNLSSCDAWPQCLRQLTKIDFPGLDWSCCPTPPPTGYDGQQVAATLLAALPKLPLARPRVEVTTAGARSGHQADTDDLPLVHPPGRVSCMTGGRLTTCPNPNLVRVNLGPPVGTCHMSHCAMKGQPRPMVRPSRGRLFLHLDTGTALTRVPWCACVARRRGNGTGGRRFSAPQAWGYGTFAPLRAVDTPHKRKGHPMPGAPCAAGQAVGWSASEIVRSLLHQCPALC